MILLSTSSLQYYWLHRIFMFAHKAWFDWLNLAMSNNHYDYWDEDYVKQLSDSFRLPILSITAPSRWLDKEKVDKILKIAKKVWAQVITFSPPHIRDKDSSWFWSYLLKLKKDSHLTIAIQNVEPKFLFFIIPEFKNANLNDIKKVTWDVTLDLSSIDPSSWLDIVRAFKILWNSVKNILLSDRQWPNSWLLPWNAWWWTSHLPLESFFINLKEYWYSWFVTLSVKPSEMWNKEEIVLENLNHSINYYNKYFTDYK